MCGCFPSLRRILNECVNGKKKKKKLSKAEKAEELDVQALSQPTVTQLTRTYTTKQF